MSDFIIPGAARAAIDAAEAARLRASGVLVVDSRRERPRYFDGRFLAARDLIRDQQYFLMREADLGRSSGSGVIDGLQVSEGAQPQTLVVGAGHGLTPAGELVLLPAPLQIDLTDIPQAEQLSARFGLGRRPVAPARSRTGLYVLALRPVEFSANPVAAYPTSLTGPRSVEDGDIIEATALVLVPWQDDGAADALEARRSRAARAIFVQGERDSGTSDNVLPLAMLALQGNSLVWLDMAMVRRELGADRGDLPGLGLAPRGLRLAHLLQHQEHLADVVALMQGRSFAAASRFDALPPAGPLPPGTIDTADFTQRYFPSQVDVEFSIIPEDELPALVEESLALPPIDLRDSDAALDATAVLMLAPVSRTEFRRLAPLLVPRLRVLKAAAPNRVAQQKPLEMLLRLRLPAAVDTGTTPADQEWAALARLPTLWYVRRRNLAWRADLAGRAVAAVGRNELVAEQAVRTRIASLGLTPALDRVLGATSTATAARVMTLLATPTLQSSPTLTAATLGALAGQIQPIAGETATIAAAAPTTKARSAGTNTKAIKTAARADDTINPAPTGAIELASVLALTAEVERGQLGLGLQRLETATHQPVTRTALIALASGDAWRQLDHDALQARPDLLGQLASRLRRGAAEPPAAPAPDPDQATDLAPDAADPSPKRPPRRSARRQP